jgi:hypothetical protein
MDATTPLITVYLLDDRMAGQRLASAAPSRFYPMARCWLPNASGVLGYRHRRGPIRALPSLARLVPASRPGPPDHLRASGGQLVGGQGPAASAAARPGWPIISILDSSRCQSSVRPGLSLSGDQSFANAEDVHGGYGCARALLRLVAAVPGSMVNVWASAAPFSLRACSRAATLSSSVQSCPAAKA